MLDPTASIRALRRLFRRRAIADLETIGATLETSSRMSIFRRLRSVGYHSSITHRGRYYTLEDVPSFDEDGLWFFEGVGFSEHGTLKKTVAYLVTSAPAGRTHEELQDHLRVRVHNPLLELVQAGRVRRRRLGPTYLYLNPETPTAAAQLAARQDALEAERELDLAPEIVIAILVEVLKATKAQVDPKRISTRLRRRGITVTAAAVEHALTRHGIEKKTAR